MNYLLQVVQVFVRTPLFFDIAVIHSDREKFFANIFQRRISWVTAISKNGSSPAKTQHIASKGLCAEVRGSTSNDWV